MSLPAAGGGVTRAAWPIREPAGTSQSSDHSIMLTLQMSLLRVKDGYPVSVGDIVATVEDEPQVGKIMMVRFFEGPGSGMDR